MHISKHRRRSSEKSCERRGKSAEREGVARTMELRFKNSASVELESFIDRYRGAFRELYSDTGLWNESLIIAGYEENAWILYRAIRGSITDHLTRQPVMSRKRVAKDWYEVHISVEDRHIIVLYSEDKRENTRWVESISIGRKPIIF